MNEEFPKKLPNRGRRPATKREIKALKLNDKVLSRRVESLEKMLEVLVKRIDLLEAPITGAPEKVEIDNSQTDLLSGEDAKVDSPLISDEVAKAAKASEKEQKKVLEKKCLDEFGFNLDLRCSLVNLQAEYDALVSAKSEGQEGNKVDPPEDPNESGDVTP